MLGASSSAAARAGLRSKPPGSGHEIRCKPKLLAWPQRKDTKLTQNTPSIDHSPWCWRVRGTKTAPFAVTTARPRAPSICRGIIEGVPYLGMRAPPARFAPLPHITDRGLSKVRASQTAAVCVLGVCSAVWCRGFWRQLHVVECREVRCSIWFRSTTLHTLVREV